MTVTVKSLSTEVKALKKQIDEMQKRTGCPKGYMPVYKLAKHLSVSEELIKFAISQKTVATRTYATESGGHIINCTGYNIRSTTTAVKAVKTKSVQKGVMFLHESGRYFKGEL